ncbi:MAG: DUF6512 family protein [Nitrososphaerota archaeon]
MGPIKSSKSLVLRLELIGIAFITVLGSALHFTYELSGYNPLVGVFSAVNESVWEHLKLSFWPAMLYAAVEHRFLGRTVGNFHAAKGLGILVMPFTIVGLFYLYTAFLEENLLIDILIFVVAVAVGQLTSYRLMLWRPIPKAYQISLITALAILSALFTVFTFLPPRLPIFMDPVSGGYGVSS